MPESAKVEILIDAFTEAAQQAVDEVGDSLNGLSADAQPAQSAMDEVSDELNDTTSSAAIAGEAMDEAGSDAAQLAAAMQGLQGRADEAGDEVAQAGAKAGVTSGLFSSLTVSTNGLSVAMGTLSTVAMVSLVPSLLTLSTVLLPLASILGGVIAAVGSLAAVFGGLAVAGVVTHMEELRAALADAKAEIQEIIQPLGDVFGPLLVDAVEALPDLVRSIVDSLGPLDQFAQTLRELGALAMDVIPAMTGVMFDLAQTALPVLIDVIEDLRAAGPGLMNAVAEAVDRLDGPLTALGSALADVLPTLHELGIVVGELVFPALTAIFNVIDTVAEMVLSLDDALRDLAVAGTITAPAIFAVASSVGSLLGPVGLAAGAVAALAAAYRSNFLGIQDVVNSAVSDVIDRVRAFWTAHQDVFNRVREVFRQYLAAVRSNLRAIQPHLQAIASNLTDLLGQALTLVGDILRGLVPIFERVAGVLMANQDHFRALGGAILQGVNVAIDVLQELLGVVRFVFEQFILPLLDEVTSVWAMHFGTILDETVETMDAIQSAIQPVLDAVEDFWNQHGDAITDAVTSAFDVIITYVGGVMDTLYTAIIVLLNVIQGDWGEAWDAMTGLLDRSLGRWMDIFESLGLGGVMASEGQAVQGALQTYIIQPLRGVVEFFRRWAGVAMRVFQAHFSRLRGLYRTHAGPLVQEFRETWNAILNNIIRPLMKIISTVIGVYLDIVRANINAFITVVSALWSAFGDEILTVAEAAWNAVSVVIVTLIDGILTAIRVFLNVLQGDWGEAWDAIAGYVSRTVDRITGFIDDWATPLYQAFIGVLEGIWTLTTDFWNGLVNWMANPLGQLLTQFEVWGNTLRNILVSVWNAVVNVVAGATETLINNAVSAINAFLSTLDDVADAVSEIPHVNAPDVSQLSEVSVDTSGLTAEQRTINRQEARRQNVEEVETTLTVEGNSPLADFIRENVQAESERENRQDTRRTRRQNSQ